MSKTKADRKVRPSSDMCKTCAPDSPHIRAYPRADGHIQWKHSFRIEWLSLQAERAEKKAAKQAGKSGKKAAVLEPALLQLPATITASQRARIHAAARSVGLFHESSGEGDARVLTVGHETADLVRKRTHKHCSMHRRIQSASRHMYMNRVVYFQQSVLQAMACSCILRYSSLHLSYCAPEDQYTLQNV